MLFAIPIIFVLVHGPDGDYARSYDGLPPETVTSLLQQEGKTLNIVTQKEYDDFIATHKPVTKPTDPVRDQAKTDAINRSKTADERLNALTKYLGVE